MTAESGKRRAETTRQVILEAAEMVFAEHGFDGARVDTIAEVAGYDKKLIFRYFGDKLSLYGEVLRRSDQEIRKMQSYALEPVFMETTSSSLATAIGAIFDYLVEHPRFRRILTWEMAEGWQSSAKIIAVEDRNEIENIGPFLAEIQRAGWLRSGFSPTIQMTMIMQICQSYLAFLPLYQMLIPNEDVSSADALARAREYIIALILNGMTHERESDEGKQNSEQGSN